MLQCGVQASRDAHALPGGGGGTEWPMLNTIQKRPVSLALPNSRTKIRPTRMGLLVATGVNF